MAANVPVDPNAPAVPVLTGMSRAFPRQAEEDATGITGANTMQMQQLAGRGAAAGTGPAASATPSTVAQAGAQMATQAAGSAAKAGEQAGALQLGAAKQQVQAEGVQQAAAGAAQRLTAAQRVQQNNDRLAKLSQSTQNELVARNLQFQTDKTGQTVLNDIQLTDWTKLNAQNEEELHNNMQTIQLAHDRAVEFAKTRYQALSQYMQDIEAGKVQGITNAAKLQAAGALAAAKLQFNQEQAKKSAFIQAATGVGTVVGAVVGAYVGGPMGAAAGASVGGGLGAAGGSAYESNQ